MPPHNLVCMWHIPYPLNEKAYLWGAHKSGDTVWRGTHVANHTCWRETYKLINGGCKLTRQCSQSGDTVQSGTRVANHTCWRDTWRECWLQQRQGNLEIPFDVAHMLREKKMRRNLIDMHRSFLHSHMPRLFSRGVCHIKTGDTVLYGTHDVNLIGACVSAKESCAYMYMCVRLCVYLYIYIYICVYVFVYTYIYI